MSFQDIIKQSVLKLEAFRVVSYVDMVLGLAFSFLIGMFIYWIIVNHSAVSFTAIIIMFRLC